MSNKPNSVFTSESVSKGHPDKLADQISASVLDWVIQNDPIVTGKQIGRAHV